MRGGAQLWQFAPEGEAGGDRAYGERRPGHGEEFAIERTDAGYEDERPALEWRTGAHP